MKIVHIVQGLERTSGVSLFCVQMCNRMAVAGHIVTLVYERIYEFKTNSNVRVLQSGRLDNLGLTPDIAHVHGLWSPFCARALHWLREHSIPYVVSPHGCLMPWAMRRGWFKKHLFFRLFLRKSMSNASFIHATTEAEADACRKVGVNSHFVVAPLGVELPAHIRCVRDNPKKTILFLSRVSREKGIEMLLDAWKECVRPEWRLVVAGPSWKGYLETLADKVKNESIDNVEFPGSLVGDEKTVVYQQADLFVLPSFSENFGVVVVEALSFGVPAIVTQGAPWRMLDEVGCGWWVEQSVDALKTALDAAMELSDTDRAAMGARGRAFVEGHYSWRLICEKMLANYKQQVRS